MNTIRDIQKELEPLKQKLINHSLYQHLSSTNSIRKFMEVHCFAVWDFMLLVKHLQFNLTSTSFPWKPSKSPEIRRFINEIVLAEESDIDQNGNAISHFELYLQSMKYAGCDLTRIESFINRLPHISSNSLTPQINDFISFTINSVQNSQLHEVAAIFTFGRENLIPDMFTEIVVSLNKSFGQFDTFLYYLNRHIELDSDDHGPIALKMVNELCGRDQQKWDEVLVASIKALERRINLWDYIEEEVLKLDIIVEV